MMSISPERAERQEQRAALAMYGMRHNAVVLGNAKAPAIIRAFVAGESVQAPAAPATPSPVAPSPAAVSSRWLFDEYERQVSEKPHDLKKVRWVGRPFVERFPVVPLDWPPVGDWLKATWQGEGRTRQNAFDTLKAVLSYGVKTLKALPHSPLEDAPRPEAQSRPASPLSLDHLVRLHALAMEGKLRDRCIWLLRFALGWRPVEVERLTVDNVKQAIASGDGFISREQKHRRRKALVSPSPILPEVLASLAELVESQPGLSGDTSPFRAKGGRHTGNALGKQGVYRVIAKLFEGAGVKAEIPDAIPYDLRDSFAAHVGRGVVASGGRISEAREVTKGLLGHGDGGDVLELYWGDDLRPLELGQYSPLRLVEHGGERVPETVGGESEAGGGLAERVGFEPTVQFPGHRFSRAAP